MHHGNRQMVQVGPTHWVIRCKVCHTRRQHFESAKDCHDWWRNHTTLPTHAAMTERWPAFRDDLRLFRSLT
mgnify:CR=1 FL=1